MTSKISKYEVIHRGECVNYMPPGTWVFIQRALCYSGGFWFGRVYNVCFWLEFEKPTSLSIGIDYLMKLNSLTDKVHSFDDDFQLDLLLEEDTQCFIGQQRR